MRIVQLANLYSPVSGGLRTAVDMLGAGYAAAGHQRALVVPARAHTRTEDDRGLLITVPGASVAPGYRFVLDPRPVLRVLARLRPDVVEVSDKASLTVAARWARRRGIRTVLFSHERLDAILAPHTPGWLPLEPVTDRWNRRLAAAFDAIVTTSAFAAAEFARVGAPRLHRVPLGVDLATFRPAGTGGDDRLRLVHLGRLSREKRPELALATVRELRRRGVPVHLDVVGSGPLYPALRSLAAHEALPVRFHGHVHGRGDVAALLAAADVALATCPVESFGLAVLEALACGTPVVAADRGAAHELLAPDAGIAAPPTPTRFADAVQHLCRLPRSRRRGAARARAGHYPWAATTARMLEILEGP
ncbi:glycosyltransferase [Actinomadura sp. K4S16]|uniref:glycosyltransferase n=1 Tax=Actinomadura sp. K4S16 TaxID=1316147 RepID=UPI0011EEDE2C|nr:glycosyltransferase [Actinomadura sp. K4S16]